MKNIIFFLCLIPVSLFFMTSCSEWNDIETKEIDHIGGHNTQYDNASNLYYKNLREWKETSKEYGRPVSFGWFSNWTPSGSVRKGYLESLPDSMDMVSIWSAPFNISEAQIRDKKMVQEKKGTKVFVCYIIHNIGTGITPVYISDSIRHEFPDLNEEKLNTKIRKAEEEYWGFTSKVKGSPDHLEAIRKYARVLCDSIEKYDYDGLDIDWEPDGAGDGDGNLKNRRTEEPGKYLHVLVEELGKYIGPLATERKSEKRRLLIVDGELHNISPESGKYFDYIISQAYSNILTKEKRTQQAASIFGEYYNTRKHIFTENFESKSDTGGSLLSHAKFNSSLGPKGGMGAFRLDNDYDNLPDYKYMRQAIQVMLKSYEEYLDGQDSEETNDN